MAKQMLEVGTITVDSELQRQRDSYKKCELLKVIQHIDIYGKIRSNYAQNRKRNFSDALVTMSSVSCYSPKSSKQLTKQGLDEKLSKLSMITKVSGLYPGNDILSKRSQHQQKLKLSNAHTNCAFASIVFR